MKAYVDASPTKLCVLMEDGRKIIRDATRPHTNNEAEYLAVLVALREGADIVYSDSQLVVRQLSGEYKINKTELGVLAAKIWERVDADYQICDGVYKLTCAGKVKFIWIPREENPAGKVLG